MGKRKKTKLKSVTRVKKRPPRLDLAHMEKQARPQSKKSTLKHVETVRPVTMSRPVSDSTVEQRSNPNPLPDILRQDDIAPGFAAGHSSSIPTEETVSALPAAKDPDSRLDEDATATIQRKLKRLSLVELQRYAKQSAKGADAAIVEHEALSMEYEAKLEEIKQAKTPKNATEVERKELNDRRSRLRKERDSISRRRTIAYQNAVALERAADEYAMIVALLLDQAEVNYRKQPRINEKSVALTDEEKLSLIERFLSSGRFNAKETKGVSSPVPRSLEKGGISATGKTATSGTSSEISGSSGTSSLKGHGGFWGTFKWLLMFLPALFIVWRRRRLDEAAKKLPHVKEPVEKPVKEAKLPPKEIPPEYRPEKKADGGRCHGATADAAMAEAARHAQEAGAGASRRIALDNAIPAQTKQSAQDPSSGETQVNKVAAIAEDAASSDDETIGRIKRISHSKLNFLQRWFGDIAGLIISLLIILLCFLLPLYVVADVVKGELTWEEFVTNRGRSTTAVVVSSEPVPVEPAPQPAQMELAEPIAEMPVVEKLEADKPAAPAVLPVSKEPVRRTVGYMGYVANITSYDGHAAVSYPAFITNEELDAFCETVASRYGALVSGAAYELLEPGQLSISYPVGISAEDRAAMIDQLTADLAEYVNVLVAEPKAVSTPVAVEPSILEPELAIPVPVVVESPVTRTVEYLGHVVAVESYDGRASISYPSFITDDGVIDFCSAEAEKYGASAASVSYAIGRNGRMTVFHPQGISSEDRAYVIDLLAEDLLDYVQGVATPVVSEVPMPEIPAIEPAVPEGIAEPAIVPSIHVHRVISLWGDEFAVIGAYDGNGVVLYPQYVSSEEIVQAAVMLFAAYPTDLNEVYYEIPNPGRLVVTYPKGLSEDELNGYVDVLESELRWYLSYLAGKDDEPGETAPVKQAEPEAVPPIAPVVEPVVEEPVRWSRPVHSLSISGSPYGFSFVDFYKGRKAIINAGIPMSEFMSSYGFGAQLGNFTEHLYAGVSAGFYGYYTRRSILGVGTLYTQIPVQVRFGFHHDWKHVGLSCGVGAGVDVASLQKLQGVYFMATVDLGISYRFSEHWSLQWRAIGGLTLQPKPADPTYSSNTYVTQPVMLGVVYHF